MTPHRRQITVHYARCIYRAEATFDVDGEPMRVDGVWLLASRFRLGEAGLAALREAIEAVNGLLRAEPELCFSFEDYARCEAVAASATGALARAMVEEKERYPWQ
jgi:hypothetical protein